MGKVIVQKFGGTSVQDRASRELALDHVQTAIEAGNKVVMVVSAMGRKGAPYATDSLFGLVDTDHQTNLTAQELDQLLATGELISMSVMVDQARQRSLKTIGMTGAQAGIITNDDYQNARVQKVVPDAILRGFRQADVIVVTGFQGVTTDGHVTTLGRGGSDTSATAIGAALNAQYVDIFTDVAGVMDHDPQIDPHAKLIPFLTYQEMQRMADAGTKVVHPRAVKIAMRAGIPFRVRSTYRAAEDGCTIIGSEKFMQR